MKKLLIAVAVMLLMMSGCAKKEEAPAENNDQVLVTVNTYGPGHIALAEGSEVPAIDKEYPATSAGLMVDKGATVSMYCEPDEDYVFVKWTKNGADYSNDQALTDTVEEKSEYVAVFAMSSGYDGPTVDKIEDAKVIGDVLGLPQHGYSMVEGKYVCAFELNNTVYRAESNISKETFDALMALDFDDPEYDKKYNEMVAFLPIDKIINISEAVPSQEEMDKLVGMSCEELVNKGWTADYYNGEDKVFGMNYGYFSYLVKVDGEPQITEDGDLTEAFKPFKVTAVTYEGLGYATNPDYNGEGF